MKKYLLLASFAILANIVFSQSFRLTDTLGNVMTNDTLVIISSPDNGTIEANAEVKNITSGSINVKVRKVVNSFLSGSTNTFCWGSCFSPSTLISPNSLAIAAGAIRKTDFKGDYSPNGAIGITTITYYFINTSAVPKDSDFVVIKYDTNPQSFVLKDSLGNVISNRSLVFTSNPNVETIRAIEVVNNTTDSIHVKVRKVVNSFVPGSINTFSWGISFLPETMISPSDLSMAGGTSRKTDFKSNYTPNGAVGTTTITYYFINTTAIPNDSTFVVVKYITTTSGVSSSIANQMRISNPYPNPANNSTTFNYNFPTDINYAKLTIYNLLGVPIKDIEVPEKNGVLVVPTFDIKSGVYFYSLMVDDKTIISKKLVIKH